jgi:hypothetical protein
VPASSSIAGTAYLTPNRFALAVQHRKLEGHSIHIETKNLSGHEWHRDRPDLARPSKMHMHWEFAPTRTSRYSNGKFLKSADRRGFKPADWKI